MIIQLFGGLQISELFGDILTKHLRTQIFATQYRKQHNADIRNWASTFYAPLLGDSKSATIIKISRVFNIETTSDVR
jgi:hypothetical protein